MNKKELAKVIVAENDYAISEKCARQMIDSFMGAVKAEVAKGGSVRLTDFGTFTSGKRAERTYKDIQTGEKKVIPACTTPKFQPSQTFKDVVNQ